MTIPFRTLTKPLALTAVAALTFGLVGCSTPDAPTAAPEPATTASSSAPSAEATPSASETPSASASESASASPSTAAADNSALLAAGRLGSREVKGTVSSIESEAGGYEVHIVTSNGSEQQLRTNASGEKVTAGPVDDPADDEDRAENQQFAKIKTSYREAVRAVEREIDGAKITELSLDRDLNRSLWEAEVTIGSEQRSVQINAANGRVVSNELDD